MSVDGASVIGQKRDRLFPAWQRDDAVRWHHDNTFFALSSFFRMIALFYWLRANKHQEKYQIERKEKRTMLNYRQVLANASEYQELLARRGYELPLETLQALDGQRLSLLQEVEECRRQVKEGSREVGKLLQQSQGQETAEIVDRKTQVTLINERIKQLNSDLSAAEARLETIMLDVPNIPAPQTPLGHSDQENPVLRVWGEKPLFDFPAKSHDELGEKMGILDFERGAKLAGSRFTVMKGAASRLERALTLFLLDMAALEHGYTQVSVPYMVNRKTITGTGQLPKFEDDMFRVISEGREFFLIPTAEVPVTNLHADEILPEESLPLLYCSLTPCFRAEAGSAGRDVKGLIRQHQFDKVEMVHISKPEDSWKQLEIMTHHAEHILQRLGLHYRVVALCTGDIGFSAQFTYDLEVWLPSQNAYREISSCSNCGDFQARRAKIRYKRQDTGKNELVHTLNGSGLPVGRTLIAIMEQYQRSDGSIVIPEPLHRYTGFSHILPDGSMK
jgi:seryl-tRNA synthetase